MACIGLDCGIVSIFIFFLWASQDRDEGLARLECNSIDLFIRLVSWHISCRVTMGMEEWRPFYCELAVIGMIDCTMFTTTHISTLGKATSQYITPLYRHPKRCRQNSRVYQKLRIDHLYSSPASLSCSSTKISLSRHRCKKSVTYKHKHDRVLSHHHVYTEVHVEVRRDLNLVGGIREATVQRGLHWDPTG